MKCITKSLSSLFFVGLVAMAKSCSTQWAKIQKKVYLIFKEASVFASKANNLCFLNFFKLNGHHCGVKRKFQKMLILVFEVMFNHFTLRILNSKGTFVYLGEYTFYKPQWPFFLPFMMPPFILGAHLNIHQELPDFIK